MTDSLFGHLAFRFSKSPENIAIEALGYILKNSAEAQKGLLQALGLNDAALDELTWTTQATGEDAARPDLVGRAADGSLPVVIEVKFWAGLTGNQPLTYLKHVAPRGTLVFVCPKKRLPFLWHELVRRLSQTDTIVPSDQSVRSTIVDGKAVVLKSWHDILNVMQARTESAGERTATESIRQLLGLCDRMDAEAFIPLTGEELTSSIYRRVLQFNDVVDEVVDDLLHKGVADVKGLRATATKGWYGRYVRLHGAFCLIQCSIAKWTTFAATPLWLCVYGPKWNKGNPSEVFPLLATLQASNPPRVFAALSDGFPAVPLFVSAGAEKHEIVGEVVRQVLEVGELIRPLGITGETTLPPGGESQPDPSGDESS